MLSTVHGTKLENFHCAACEFVMHNCHMTVYKCMNTFYTLQVYSQDFNSIRQQAKVSTCCTAHEATAAFATPHFKECCCWTACWHGSSTRSSESRCKERH